MGEPLGQERAMTEWRARQASVASEDRRRPFESDAEWLNRLNSKPRDDEFQRAETDQEAQE